MPLSPGNKVACIAWPLSTVLHLTSPDRCLPFHTWPALTTVYRSTPDQPWPLSTVQHLTSPDRCLPFNTWPALTAVYRSTPDQPWPLSTVPHLTSPDRCVPFNTEPDHANQHFPAGSIYPAEWNQQRGCPHHRHTALVLSSTLTDPLTGSRHWPLGDVHAVRTASSGSVSLAVSRHSLLYWAVCNTLGPEHPHTRFMARSGLFPRLHRMTWTFSRECQVIKLISHLF